MNTKKTGEEKYNLGVIPIGVQHKYGVKKKLYIQWVRFDLWLWFLFLQKKFIKLEGSQ